MRPRIRSQPLSKDALQGPANHRVVEFGILRGKMGWDPTEDVDTRSSRAVPQEEKARLQVGKLVEVTVEFFFWDPIVFYVCCLLCFWSKLGCEIIFLIIVLTENWDWDIGFR